MVTDPASYKWSSYRCKVEEVSDPVVDLHPFYLALGSKEEERQQAYIDYVSGTIPDYEVKLIYEALQRGQVTGGDRFREELTRNKSTPWSTEETAQKWKNIGHAAFKQKNGLLWDIGSRIGHQLRVCDWRLREISEA